MQHSHRVLNIEILPIHARKRQKSRLLGGRRLRGTLHGGDFGADALLGGGLGRVHSGVFGGALEVKCFLLIEEIPKVLRKLLPHLLVITPCHIPRRDILPLLVTRLKCELFPLIRDNLQQLH